MNIVELLKSRGLDTKKSTKMIRHTDHGVIWVSKMTRNSWNSISNAKVNQFLVLRLYCVFSGA